VVAFEHAAQRHFLAQRVHGPVQLVPVPGETGLVHLRRQGQVIGGLEFVAHHRVAVGSCHEVLGRGGVATHGRHVEVCLGQTQVRFARLFVAGHGLPTQDVTPVGRRPPQLGDAVGFVEARVPTSIEHLETVAGELHPLEAVATGARLAPDRRVGLLVAKTSRFHPNTPGEFFVRDGGGDHVQGAAGRLGAKRDLAPPLAHLHTLHAGHRGEVVRRRCGVRRRCHQHAVLHQGDARRTICARAAHADVGPQAKPILLDQIQPRQGVQRLHRVGVGHLAEHLGRQALHRPRNFAGVPRPCCQPHAAHLRFRERMPELGHHIQAVLWRPKIVVLGEGHLGHQSQDRKGKKSQGHGEVLTRQKCVSTSWATIPQKG